MSTTRVKTRRVADLIPYARNAKQHSAEQISKVAASIKEFGFLRAVITDGENGILAGHCSVLAAAEAGLEKVPTLDAGHLTDAQRRAFVLADNRLSETGSSWDMDLLGIELHAIADAGEFDLELSGFSLEELDSEEEEDEQVGDADAVDKGHKLTIDRRSVVISADEANMLTASLSQYEADYESSFGWVTHLLEKGIGA